MPPIKDTVKEKYAEALEKAKEKKDTVCCSEGSVAEHNPPEKGLFSDGLIAPSFGCIFDLPGRADIKVGDVIVDFGSGSGYDLIRAAKLSGSHGKAIGIDMTPEMVQQAKENIEKMGLANVEIKLGEIEKVPLEDEVADIVISNCVINLSLNKQAVFNEAYRILKPGGRLVDADKIVEEELPQSLRDNPDAWCGCVSGALTKEGYTKIMEKAGFKDIEITIEDKSSFEWNGKKYTLLNGILRAVKK